MNKIVLIILTLLITSCMQDNSENKEYMKFVSQQTQFINKKYELLTFGLGGFNKEGLKGYSLDFISYKKTNLEQARNLIVNVIEDILKNGNEALRKEGKMPLTLDHYELGIAIFDKDTQTFSEEDQGLAIVRFCNKKIYYSVNRQGSKKRQGFSQLDTIYSEPYQEAYEKVTNIQLQH